MRSVTLDKRSANPYSHAELIRITDWANTKRQGALGQYKWLILALGLRAGLRGVEMDHLTWKQVEVDGHGVILQDLNGRDVPVHRDWADVLAEARAGADNVDEYLLLYPKRKRRYTVASSCAVASRNEGIKPSLPRLRDTWIVNRIAEGVPERLVRQIAGLTDER